MRLPRLLASSALLAIVLVASAVSPIAGAVLSSGAVQSPFKVVAYVSPLLYTDDYWTYGAYVEDPAHLAFDGPESFPGGDFHILNGDVRVARAIVLLERSASPGVLRGKVRGFLGTYPTHLYKLVNVVVTPEDVERLARTPGVIAVLPDVRMDPVFGRSSRLLAEAGGEHGPLATTSGSGGPYHYTVNITRAIDVWLEHGVRGEGVTIAVIDTGVDYGSPALGLEAVARDGYGLPLVFDVSSLGLVLTPVEAEEVGGGYVKVDPEKLYVFYQPYYVFKWSQGLWVSVSGCRSYSAYVSWPGGNLWHVGDIPRHGPPRFGLMMYYVTTSLVGTSTTIRFTAPVLVVDSDGDGLYDRVYVDTSTALYLLRLALAPAPCSVTIPGAPAAPDYSFADEEPVYYGREVVARDLDGDGIADFSIGTLAGYVYDAAYAILYELFGVWRELVTPLPHGYGYRTDAALARELWSYEPVALVWPGLDPLGSYVVLQYDYDSHGTFCATTAAGRDYYAQTGYGVRSIAGQAPAAKVAAAPALYFGTVVTSVYFFTGFDLVTPYGIGSRYLWPALRADPWIAFDGYTWEWVYTGERRADMTSNSYGVSGWALWGWASGMDPEGAVFDYTTLVSGMPHFIAVGNGGPGWGTIASPASSTLSIGVGAATEFTYRPIYAYSWPGSSRQVVSWSNRGPTELGVVKPDVVAVGSFAWAVGRTWDSLRNVRRIDGRQLHGLFSGTSQATPMAAGVGALVASAYRRVHGNAMPAHLLKTLLMNYATDMGFDELSQGAGFVNAYRAVSAVLNPAAPSVYSADILADLLSELSGTHGAATYGAPMRGTWFEPKLFVPAVAPGETVERTLLIEGEGRFRAYAARLGRLDTRGLCDIVTRVFDPAVVVGCSGEDLRLSVTTATVYGHVALDPSLLLSADFFEIEVAFPFEHFESGGRTGTFSVLIPTTALELAYWIDANGDGSFSWLETARIYYDIRRANAVRIQIANLAGQIEEIEYLAEKLMGRSTAGLEKAIVVRVGVSGATFRGVLPLRVRLVRYKYERWHDVLVAPSTLSVRGRAALRVFVTGPARPGFYSGYVVVEDLTRGGRHLVPLSLFVPIDMTVTRSYRLSPADERSPYRNTYLRGAFDYTWRYESGDWRVFKVLVPSTSSILGVRVTWPTHGKPAYASNLDVMVFGPWTYYMVDDQTGEVIAYRVEGVQLGAELSRDPRGGGGYNPTRFWDSVGPGESSIVAPTTSHGIYRVVVRNVQFSGMAYEEPFTLELRLVYAVFTIPRTLFRMSIGGWLLVYGPSDLYPVRVTPGNEAVFRPAGAISMYYIADLSGYGVSIALRDPTPGTTYWRARVEVSFGPGTYRGAYIVPFDYETGAPVFTVGWVDGGTPRVYYYSSTLPIYLRVTQMAGL